MKDISGKLRPENVYQTIEERFKESEYGLELADGISKGGLVGGGALLGSGRPVIGAVLVGTGVTFDGIANELEAEERYSSIEDGFEMFDLYAGEGGESYTEDTGESYEAPALPPGDDRE